MEDAITGISSEANWHNGVFHPVIKRVGFISVKEHLTLQENEPQRKRVKFTKLPMKAFVV